MTDKSPPKKLTIDANNDRVFTKEDMGAALRSPNEDIKNAALRICAPLFALGDEIEGGLPQDLPRTYFVGTADKMKKAVDAAMDKKVFSGGIAITDEDVPYIYERYKMLAATKTR